MIDRRSFLAAMAGTIVGDGLSGRASIAQEAPNSPPTAWGIAEPACNQIVEGDRRTLLRTVNLSAVSSEDAWAGSLTEDADAIAALVREMKAEAFKGLRGSLARALAFLSYPFYQAHGHYIAGSDAFARRSHESVSAPELPLLQRQYLYFGRLPLPLSAEPVKYPG